MPPSDAPALRDRLATGDLVTLYETTPALQGRDGRRRGPREFNDLGVDDDLSAVELWIQAKSRRSVQTRLAYTREAERLLRWCWLEAELALSDLTQEHLLRYTAFLEQPPASWICARKVNRADPAWRPFRGPMPPTAVGYALTIVSDLMNWLAGAGYLLRNPVPREVRQTHRRTGSPTRFALTPATWAFVLETIEGQPRDRPQEEAQYERERYVMTLLYLMDFRRGDLGNNPMSAFQRFMIGGRYLWFWCGLRKGGQRQQLPANEAVMSAVRRYRRSLGLTSYPSPKESTGMVLDLEGKRALTGDMVYRIVKQVFQRAAIAAQTQPHRLNDEEIDALSQATTHWMRHTSITAQIAADIPLLDVQGLAGHGDAATTQIYITRDLAALHAAASRHGLAWPDATRSG